jgi:hypothetical protein
MLSFFSASECSAAGELVGKRPAKAYPAATNGAVTISQNTRANMLPDAYLFYSKSLSLFYVTYYDENGVIEDVPMPIPAGSSLILPGPRPYLTGGVWVHKMYINATAGSDSVYIIPMVR